MSYIEIDTTTAQLIDTTSAPVFFEWQQSTQLDGREYLLNFAWIERGPWWYLSIFDQDENPLAQGVKLVVSVPGKTPTLGLLRRFQDTRLPPGVLVCMDLSGAGQEIMAPTDLGVRVPLFYQTAT